MRTSESSTRSGNSDWRAVAPGALSRAPTKTSVSSCPSSIPVVEWRSGIAAPAAALPRSAMTLVAREPVDDAAAEEPASTTGRKVKKTASRSAPGFPS
jgi:hypothetical protein